MTSSRLQVYSTLARRKVPFHKQPGETVTMYVCGPTVYKPAHIGHMVGPVIFDVVKRRLTTLGYQVRWVVNITDVDDKLIERAKQVGKTVPALATEMTNDYFECLKALNVTGIDHFPKATEHIPGMIRVMDRLIEQGQAYATDGDVYFDVSKDADYGKLCGFDPEALDAATNGEQSTKKRHPGDFALWKGAKPGEPPEVQYDSPYGVGRPGWHIECTCMAIELLGQTIDIHGGGLDLRFPHHENELAQSESYTGQPFAHIWMHNGLLKLRDKDGNDAKMAGSIGNVLNVVEALKYMSGDALRFFILSTHYRSPIDLGTWDWTNPATPIPDNLVVSNRAHENFVRFAERVALVAKRNYAECQGIANPCHEAFASFIRRFDEFMDDDFNTGGAVGVLFEFMGHLNKLVDAGKLENSDAADVSIRQQFLEGVGCLKFLADQLGLTFARPEQKLGGGDDTVAGLMQLLLDLRANLRSLAKPLPKGDAMKQELFAQTDLIRQRLAAMSITLEDRPGGTTWRVG